MGVIRGASLSLLFSLSSAAFGAAAQSAKPLAYARSLVVLPVRAEYRDATETGTTDPPLPGARPSLKARKELLAQRNALRIAAPATVQAGIATVLSRAAGIRDLRQVEDGEPRPGILTDQAIRHSADAALEVVVDRCGLHAGLERAVWVRVVGRLALAGGEAYGPYYGIGITRSTRKLIGKGYSRGDDELLAQASQQALAQLGREMRTGEKAPFSRGGRVLVARAEAPNETRKLTAGAAGTTEKVAVRLPTLKRQSDVLFQPELPPIVELVEAGEAESSVEELRVGSLWRADGVPDRERLRAVSHALTLDYLFISRVIDVAAEESVVEAASAGVLRPGAERKVDVTVAGALYDAAADRVIWQDMVEGGTIARTEYVRGKPRIRTDEQAVMDAAHTAYAYLRYSFDEFRRRFYR